MRFFSILFYGVYFKAKTKIDLHIFFIFVLLD